MGAGKRNMAVAVGVALADVGGHFALAPIRPWGPVRETIRALGMADADALRILGTAAAAAVAVVALDGAVEHRLAAGAGSPALAAWMSGTEAGLPAARVAAAAAVKRSTAHSPATRTSILPSWAPTSPHEAYPS